MSKGIFELESAQPVTGDNLLLIDALNLAFRYKHKRQRNFAADYIRTVDSFAKSYNCSNVIICADKGSSSYRKSIFPEYKGNRKEKYKDQTDAEKQEFAEFLEDFESTMSLIEARFPLLRYDGVEADDIIAAVCYNSDKNIWIVSSDKDMDQLVNDHVSRFCYYTRKEIKEENFADKYDCTPQEYISMKVLTGDKGDNVPGIPLVGEKRADNLIRQHGSAMNLFDAMPIPGKGKVIENINGFADQIFVNYELMDLGFYPEALGDNLQDVLETINAIS